MLASFLTGVAFVTATDPTQRTGNFADDYVVWPLALGAWILTLYLARFDWRRLQAFRTGELGRCLRRSDMLPSCRHHP